eukprot:366021-Chlamydomonas_euryale.AAC.15
MKQVKEVKQVNLLPFPLTSTATRLPLPFPQMAVARLGGLQHHQPAKPGDLLGPLAEHSSTPSPSPSSIKITRLAENRPIQDQCPEENPKPLRHSNVPLGWELRCELECEPRTRTLHCDVCEVSGQSRDETCTPAAQAWCDIGCALEDAAQSETSPQETAARTASLAAVAADAGPSVCPAAAATAATAIYPAAATAAAVATAAACPAASRAASAAAAFPAATCEVVGDGGSMVRPSLLQLLLLLLPKVENKRELTFDTKSYADKQRPCRAPSTSACPTQHHPSLSHGLNDVTATYSRMSNFLPPMSKGSSMYRDTTYCAPAKVCREREGRPRCKGSTQKKSCCEGEAGRRGGTKTCMRNKLVHQESKCVRGRETEVSQRERESCSASEPKPRRQRQRGREEEVQKEIGIYTTRCGMQALNTAGRTLDSIAKLKGIDTTGML